jgi:5-enolpyruvylshikimate-3-phosphate synthase
VRRRLDLARISLSLVLISQLLAPEEWSVRADLSGARVWLAAGRLAAGVTWHVSSRLAGHSRSHSTTGHTARQDSTGWTTHPT